MSRVAVVTLATGRKRYAAQLARLEHSLRCVGFDGEVLAWRPGEWPAGCPPHERVPFAFKPYCLDEAGRRGFEVLLWLDAACVAIRPLGPLFEQIERDGYLLFANRGARVGTWASDAALSALGAGREEALELPEVNAAAVGLRPDDATARSFLDRWKRAAREEVSFRGIVEPLRGDDYDDVKWNRNGRVSADPRVCGHRHDQTAAGLIAGRLALTLTPHGLEPFSRRHRVIGRATRIVVVRDGAAGAARLVTLRRAAVARRVGSIAGAVPLPRRGR